MRTSRTFHAPHHKGGFTMVELIAVIVILGIMAVSAIAGFMNLNSIDVKAQTEVVKRHLRYAQHKALSTNENWGIQANEAGTAYWLFEGTTTAKRLLPTEQDEDRALPRGIKTAQTGWTVTFGGNGEPQASSLPATEGTGWTLTLKGSGSDTETLTITEDTGFIP